MVDGDATINEQTAHQAAGPRRVRFEVCYSFVVATVRWRTAVYPTASAWERLARGVPFALASLAFGPWGLPWGPVWTAVAVWTNLTGGVPERTDLGSGVPADNT